MQDFVHLHVHTQYSILDGQASIPRLVDKAMANGMRGIAVTDHGDMFGIKEFFNYACKSGTFFYNNAHTFVKGAPVEFAFFVELHGFCPAFYCRERGS